MPLTLGYITRNGNRSASHLGRQTVEFVPWKLRRRAINHESEINSLLPNPQISIREVVAMCVSIRRLSEGQHLQQRRINNGFVMFSRIQNTVIGLQRRANDE